MSVVLGKNFNVYGYYNGAYQIIACATNCVLTITTETAERTTINSGTWKNFKGVANSWSVSVDGLVVLGQTLGIETIAALQMSMLPIQISLEQDDNNGNIITYSGQSVIETTEQTGQDGSASSSSIRFIGDGALNTTNTPVSTTPGSVQRYEYTAIGGETSFNAPVLINKTILWVASDGTDYMVSNTAPSNQTVLYTPASGQIDFDHPLMPGVYNAVLFQ